MGRETLVLLPTLQQRLKDIGENLRLARLRRRLQAAQVAERTGLSRPTLRAIERGDPSVSLGAYVSVLFCLGLEKGLEGLGRDDELGRALQDAQIPVNSRAPRRPQGVSAVKAAPKKADP